MNQGNSQSWSMAGLEHLNTLNLSGCLDTFLLAKQVDGLSPKYISDSREKLKPFISFCGDIAPGEVTPNHIRLYLRERQLRNSPATVKDHFGILKVWFNWLAHEKIIESPMAGMNPPKVPRVIIQPFSPQQQRDIIETCDQSTYTGVRNRAIALCLFDSGLRTQEIAALKLSNIDMEHGIIKTMGKGSKERLTGMGKETRKAIIRYVLARKTESDYLWLTEERKPLTWRGLQIAIRRIVKLAGITDGKKGPHRFRHTFAISMNKSGCVTADLQKLLGHSSLEMTENYLKSLGCDDVMTRYGQFSPVDRLKLP